MYGRSEFWDHYSGDSARDTRLRFSLLAFARLHFASLFAFLLLHALFVCLPVSVPSESHSGDSAGEARLRLSFWLFCLLGFHALLALRLCLPCLLACLPALLLTLLIIALFLALHV